MADPVHYLKQELDEQIKSDSRLFEFLQAGSLDGIWYWDLEHPEHEWMSPRYWEVFGYDPATKQHLTSEWQNLINPDDLKVALDNFQKHCADPSHPYDQVVRYRHRDGSIVWVRCRGIAIRNAEGKPIRMLGAHNDLTKVMQLEEALKQRAIAAESAARAKMDFLGNVSHELRTPLHQISALAHLISMGPVNDKQRTWLARMEAACKSLTESIDDILEVVRLENADAPLERAPFDPATILREILDSQRDAAAQKGLDLVLDEVPRVVGLMGDVGAISRALRNLVENAVRFTEKGAVRIGCSVVEERASDARLRFEVLDTGIGIDIADADRLFSVFEQVDNSRTRAYPGLGLGLAITRRIAERLDGEASFESIPGVGSRFWFTARLDKAW